jgi:hypothetical protein
MFYHSRISGFRHHQLRIGLFEQPVLWLSTSLGISDCEALYPAEPPILLSLRMRGM